MASAAGQSSTPSNEYKGVSKQTKIAGAARAIFSAYRRDDFADPEGFVVQLGTLLEGYEVAVIEYISSPITGVQRKFDYPPNIKQIGDACEAEAKRRLAMARASHSPRAQLNRLYNPPPNYPGCRANLHVFAESPQYPRVKAWMESGEADSRDYEVTGQGIKIALSVFQNIAGGRLGGGARQVAPTDAELRAIYGKREAEARS